MVKNEPRRPTDDDGPLRTLWLRFRRWWWASDATFVSRKAFAIIAVWVVFAIPAGVASLFWRQQQIVDRIEREALARVYAQCVDTNEGRAAIRHVVREVSTIPGVNAELGAELRRIVQEGLPQKNCPPEPRG